MAKKEKNKKIYEMHMLLKIKQPYAANLSAKIK